MQLVYCLDLRYLRAINRHSISATAVITIYSIVVPATLFELSTMFSVTSGFPHSGGIIISKKFIICRFYKVSNIVSSISTPVRKLVALQSVLYTNDFLISFITIQYSRASISTISNSVVSCVLKAARATKIFNGRLVTAFISIEYSSIFLLFSPIMRNTIHSIIIVSNSADKSNTTFIFL